MGLKIFRKRFIPDEIVDISKDELLYRDEELLITRWKAIKPRKDIEGGISFTFLKEGYKISRFYNHNGEFCYWYCDIINYEYYKNEDKYILIDLLVDVKVSPKGELEILDLDELAFALENGVVDAALVSKALKQLDKLLKMIKDGTFPPACCSKYEY